MTHTYDFPRLSTTVDLALFDRSSQTPRILLIRRGADPDKGKWALPGGFIDMDELVIDAARRELQEETGAVAGDVHFVGYFDALDRDPRGRTISFAFWAETEAANQSVKAADDAADAKWRDCAALPDLAFDHDEVVRAAVAAYRATQGA